MSLYPSGLTVKGQFLDWSKASFGERLKRAREGAGLTQEQLADRLGVDQVQVSKYERSVTAPGIERLEPMAEAIGDLSYMVWLVSGRGKTPPLTKRKGAHKAGGRGGDAEKEA